VKPAQVKVLLAAAAAQLRLSAGRWVRQDLPGGALAPVDQGAVQKLLRLGLLEEDWGGTTMIAVITEEGVAQAEDWRRVLAPRLVLILRRLVEAGELVRQGDEWWQPEHCLPERLPCGAVKVRQAACYDYQLAELANRGLAVAIDGRALATGAGEWCAEVNGS
jgi:hypothetical protein